MTKQERKEFVKTWYEVENIITLIEPQFTPEEHFKRPEECGPKEIKYLLQFLRFQVKMLLHDKESTERENMSLVKLVEDNQVIRRGGGIQ